MIAVYKTLLHGQLVKPLLIELLQLELQLESHYHTHNLPRYISPPPPPLQAWSRFLPSLLIHLCPHSAARRLKENAVERHPWSYRIQCEKKKNNNKNNNWFLYSAFVVWDTTQSALQCTCIITPGHWIQYQSCTHSAPSQLLGEHSGQAPLQGRTHATSCNK